MLDRFISVVALAAVLPLVAMQASAKPARQDSSRRTGIIGKLAAAANETSGPIEGQQTTSTKTAATKQKPAIKVEITDAASTLSEEIKAADSKSKDARGEKILQITISGEIKERGDTVVLFGKQAKSLKGYLDLLRRAREDKEVKSIVVRLSSADLGLAMAQELRLALREARDKGKKTVAIIEDNSQAAYLVAMACDEVVLPPSGDLMLYGVKADSYFLKNLLHKVGVNAEVVHVGQYKSYGETFTNEDFTTPARQNMTEIVEDIYKQMVDTISTDRKLTRDEAIAAINRGPANPEEAKQSRLVDRVAYAEEVIADLKKDGGEVVEMTDYSKDTSSKADEISLFSLFSMMSKTSKDTSAADKTTKYPQVAVIYAVGPISLGSNEGVGLGAEDEIAAEDLIKVLEDIKAEDKVKAIILRVNSPGGSAFASDLIWKKIEEVKRVKPVVATMSDMAASGGYYIAMGATKIIAEPGTLTGSIGVVGGKPNLKGLYDKLGVSKSTISKGDYAHLFSETSNFSDQERLLIEKMMHKTYDDFVRKAAQGRRMPFEKLNDLAQGRVWTGERAKQVGLVDEIGGMGLAISEVKQLIGLKKDDKVSLVSYPKELTLIDYLQKAIGGNVTAQVKRDYLTQAIVGTELLPRGLQNVLKSAMSIGRMFQTERVLAVMPFLPQIQ
ncbi:MAG: signal peptide peptidase SppA [Candidatus Sumerlaeaceae bacterium]